LYCLTEPGIVHQAVVQQKTVVPDDAKGRLDGTRPAREFQTAHGGANQPGEKSALLTRMTRLDGGNGSGEACTGLDQGAILFPAPDL
jgi:hypothetical protein